MYRQTTPYVLTAVMTLEVKVMTRHDYGPQGCAKRSAALMGILGSGAFLLGLGGKLGWRVTTAVLQKMEDRRAQHMQ